MTVMEVPFARKRSTQDLQSRSAGRIEAGEVEVRRELDE